MTQRPSWPIHHFPVVVCYSLSCVQLLWPHDCSLPGSSVHGILQARILAWVANSFLRGSSQPRGQTVSPALQADSLPSEPPRKSYHFPEQHSTYAWRKLVYKYLSSLTILWYLFLHHHPGFPSRTGLWVSVGVTCFIPCVGLFPFPILLLSLLSSLKSAMHVWIFVLRSASGSTQIKTQEHLKFLCFCKTQIIFPSVGARHVTKH